MDSMTGHVFCGCTWGIDLTQLSVIVEQLLPSVSTCILATTMALPSDISNNSKDNKQQRSWTEHRQYHWDKNNARESAEDVCREDKILSKHCTHTKNLVNMVHEKIPCPLSKKDKERKDWVDRQAEQRGGRTLPGLLWQRTKHHWWQDEDWQSTWLCFKKISTPGNTCVPLGLFFFSKLQLDF